LGQPFDEPKARNAHRLAHAWIFQQLWAPRIQAAISRLRSEHIEAVPGVWVAKFRADFVFFLGELQHLRVVPVFLV
jgi:hypothetical protein